jgi:hypothetical protein
MHKTRLGKRVKIGGSGAVASALPPQSGGFLSQAWSDREARRYVVHEGQSQPTLWKFEDALRRGRARLRGLEGCNMSSHEEDCLSGILDISSFIIL